MNGLFYLRQAKRVGFPLPDAFLGETKDGVRDLIHGRKTETPKWQIHNDIKHLQKTVESDFYIFNKLKDDTIPVDGLITEIRRKNICLSSLSLGTLLHRLDTFDERLEVFEEFSTDMNIQNGVLFYSLKKSIP